jgi:putative endonuclease
MAYFVYIVQCADSTYYCGYTKNLDQRVLEHNTSKKGAKYTKGRRPVKLVYSERFKDLSLALKKEHQIKRLTRGQKKLLIKTLG